MATTIWRPEKNIPQIWDVFGRLTVIGYDDSVKYWIICKCKCGKVKTINKYNLLYWRALTCWCKWFFTKNSRYIWDWIFNPETDHNDKRFHRIYLWITRRCWKPWPWEDVKNERESFEEFYRDMYQSYIKHINEFWIKQTTIDRINPYGNYCKENCRWATYSEQLSNKRWLDHYIIGWKAYRLSELVEITWLTYSKVINRYKRYQEWKYTEAMMLYRWKLKWNNYVKAWPI